MLAALSTFAMLTSSQAASVDHLAFMSGTWRCSIWGGTFEEHWSKPEAGTMIGMGRHIADGKTAFMEFLSIEPSEGGLTMWILLGAPSKGEKKGVPFKLTSVSPHEAVFENPANDFPSKITYTLKSKDNLFCKIEGNGKVEEFNFRSP